MARFIFTRIVHDCARFFYLLNLLYLRDLLFSRRLRMIAQDYYLRDSFISL